MTECQFQEALLNLTVDPGTPLWLLCSYDVQALAPDVVTEAHRSHPALVEQDTYRGSTLYGGAHHAGTVFETELPPADAPAWCRRFWPGTWSPCVRTSSGTPWVRACPPRRSADLALAVHEVATNSLVHGSGSGDAADLARGRGAGLRGPRRRTHHRPDDRPGDPGVGERGRAWAVDGQPAV